MYRLDTLSRDLSLVVTRSVAVAHGGQALVALEGTCKALRSLLRSPGAVHGGDSVWAAAWARDWQVHDFQGRSLSDWLGHTLFDIHSAVNLGDNLREGWRWARRQRFVCVNDSVPLPASPPGMNCYPECAALRFARDMRLDTLQDLNAALARVGRLVPTHFQNEVVDSPAGIDGVEAELRRLASHHPAYGQPFPSPEDKARAVEQTLELMKGADEYYVISDPSTLAPLSSYWQDWIGVMIITVAVEQRLVTYYVASDTD